MDPKEYNKLVRDKIPDRLRSKGIPFEERIADDTEYKTELVKKLTEEAAEFSEVVSVEELADVIEVVEALKKLPEFADVEKVRQEKLAERGGFEKGIILKGRYD